MGQTKNFSNVVNHPMHDQKRQTIQIHSLMLTNKSWQGFCPRMGCRMAAKQGGYDLWGFCPGVWLDTDTHITTTISKRVPVKRPRCKVR